MLSKNFLYQRNSTKYYYCGENLKGCNFRTQTPNFEAFSIPYQLKKKYEFLDKNTYDNQKRTFLTTTGKEVDNINDKTKSENEALSIKKFKVSGIQIHPNITEETNERTKEDFESNIISIISNKAITFEKNNNTSIGEKTKAIDEFISLIGSNDYSNDEIISKNEKSVSTETINIENQIVSSIQNLNANENFEIGYSKSNRTKCAFCRSSIPMVSKSLN
jgi:hypothetical protein